MTHSYQLHASRSAYETCLFDNMCFFDSPTATMHSGWRLTQIADTLPPWPLPLMAPPSCAGYPVLRQKMEFKKGGRCANKEDWNKFVMCIKVSTLPLLLHATSLSTSLPIPPSMFA